MADQFTFKGVQREKGERSVDFISFSFFLKTKMSFCPVLNDGTQHVQWIYVNKKKRD